MSLRGVKFQFRTGESVLCFEPDATKAKVLYDAKILDISVTQDKLGKRRPAYLIHFLRWNSSWDRVVPESYLLKNSDDNRALMRKLAIVSQKVKHNKSRMKKIDSVLKHHFQKLAQPDRPVDVIDSEDDGDDDDASSQDQDDSISDAFTDVSDGGSDQKHAEDNDSEKMQSDEDELSGPESEDETQPREPVKLELPNVLKQILQRDNFLIQSKNHMLNLPAALNVIGILEGYVRCSAVNSFTALVTERPSRTTRSQEHDLMASADNNLQLCKEVAEGLRVIFDFTLPMILLYNNEREQYKSLASVPLRSPVQSTENVISPNKSSSDEKRSSRSISPRCSSSEMVTGSEDADVVIRDDVEVEIIFKNDPFQKPTVTKSYSPRQGRKGRNSDAHVTNVSAVGSATESSKSLRRSSRDTFKHVDKDTVESVVVATKTPLPKLVQKEQSSRGSTPERSLLKFTPMAQQNTDSDDIFSWKLVPDEVYYEVPTAPSLIYGSHHLLRLFVRLPHILDQMYIPRRKLPRLILQLEAFIQYLADHKDDLFPESAYAGSAH